MSAAGTWIPDSNTFIQFDLSTEATASATLKDSGPLNHDATGSFGQSGSIISGFVGNGRSYTDYGGHNTPSIDGTIFQTNKTLTVDVLVKCTSLPTSAGHGSGDNTGATGYVFPVRTSNFAGTDYPFSMWIDRNGCINGEVEDSSGNYYHATSSPIFPSSNWIHCRMTCDWNAQQLKVWTGAPGTVLVNTGSLALPAGKNFNGSKIQVFLCGCEPDTTVGLAGVDKIRYSTIIRSDSFPVVTAPVVAISGVSLTPTVGILTLACSSNPVLGGDSALPAKWIVQKSDGTSLTVTGVSTSTSNILLSVSTQRNGASYTIQVPNGIVSSDGTNYTGPFSFSFTGTDTGPSVSSILPLDGSRLQVTFNRTVDPATALLPGNYSIDGGIQVTGVTQLSPAIFVLYTKGEQPGGGYNLTPSANIVDLAGNPLV